MILNNDLGLNSISNFAVVHSIAKKNQPLWTGLSFRITEFIYASRFTFTAFKPFLP